jgi:PEP-CTERM motif
MSVTFKNILGMGFVSLALAGAGSANAASVTLAPSTATIALNTTLVKQAFGLTGSGVTISALGAATLTGDLLSSQIASASVQGSGPGPITLNWAAADGISLIGGQSAGGATFSLTGLVYNAAASTLSADIDFKIGLLNAHFEDVDFLKVVNVAGGVSQYTPAVDDYAEGSLQSVYAWDNLFTFINATGDLNINLQSAAFQAMIGPNGLSVPSGNLAQINALAGKSLGVVTVTSAVPEPSALLAALAGLGVLGVALRRRAA